MIKARKIVAGLALTLVFGAGAALTSNAVTANAEETGVTPIEVSELTSLKMAAGASVRVDPEAATSGIRYTVLLDKTEYEALNAYGYDEVTFGVFIAPEYYHNAYALNNQGNITDKYYWMQDNGNFNVTDTTGKYRIGNAYGNAMRNYDNAKMAYYGSIVNMRDKNLKADYIGVGYVKAVKDGNTVYKFATLDDNVRSVADVATTAYKADDTEDTVKTSLQNMYLSKIKYTLSFKVNSDDASDFDLTRTVEGNALSDVALPELESARDRYSVDYYTDGKGKNYKVGEKITLEGDTVLTAVSYKSGIETNDEFIALGQSAKPDGTEVKRNYKLLNDLTFNGVRTAQIKFLVNNLDGNGKTITVNSPDTDLNGKSFINEIYGTVENLNYVTNFAVRPTSKFFASYVLGTVKNCVITVNAVNAIAALENNPVDSDNFKNYSVGNPNGSYVLGYIDGSGIVKDTIIVLNAKHQDGTTDFAEPYHVFSGGKLDNVVVFTSAQRTFNVVNGEVKDINGAVRLGEMKTSHQLLVAQSVNLVDLAGVEGYSVSFATDSDAVTISDNKATARKEGTANVVCTVKKGETVVGKVNITITVGGVNLGAAITDENDFIAKMSVANSGKYYLTQDLTFNNSHYYMGSQGKTGYVLKDVVGVTLNGNGHKITYTLNDGFDNLKFGACFINYTANVNISNVNFVIGGRITVQSSAFIKTADNTVIDNCLFDIDLINGIGILTDGKTSSIGGLFGTMATNCKVKNSIVDFNAVDAEGNAVTYYSALAASTTIGTFENVVVVTAAERHLYTEYTYTTDYNEGIVHDTLDGVARVTDIKNADVSKFEEAFWTFGDDNAPSFRSNPYGV